MRSTQCVNYLRVAGLAAVLCGLGFAVATLADAAPQAAGKKPKKPGGAPKSPSVKRQLELKLYRGAVLSPEAMVIATPKSCKGELALKLEWDPGKDEVRLRLRGNQALTPYPSVYRTDASYQPNLHSPEPKDVENGEYRLWIGGAAGPMESFFYDKSTGELVGWPGQAPPGGVQTEVLVLPTQVVFATPPFQPNNAGNVDFSWSFSFKSPSMGEHEQFSHYLVALVPPNLCEYNPARPDLSTFRQLVVGPYSRAEGRPFSYYLAGGLNLEVTVHPVDSNPPQKTLISAYSNTTTIGGGVPKGWQADGDAALLGAGPPIIPWAGAKTCEDLFVGFHAATQSFCEAPEPEPSPEPSPKPSPKPNPKPKSDPIPQ